MPDVPGRDNVCRDRRALETGLPTVALGRAGEVGLLRLVDCASGQGMVLRLPPAGPGARRPRRGSLSAGPGRVRPARGGSAPVRRGGGAARAAATDAASAGEGVGGGLQAGGGTGERRLRRRFGSFLLRRSRLAVRAAGLVRPGGPPGGRSGREASKQGSSREAAGRRGLPAVGGAAGGTFAGLARVPVGGMVVDRRAVGQRPKGRKAGDQRPGDRQGAARVPARRRRDRPDPGDGADHRRAGSPLSGARDGLRLPGPPERCGGISLYRVPQRGGGSP